MLGLFKVVQCLDQKCVVLHAFKLFNDWCVQSITYHHSWYVRRRRCCLERVLNKLFTNLLVIILSITTDCLFSTKPT